MPSRRFLLSSRLLDDQTKMSQPHAYTAFKDTGLLGWTKVPAIPVHSRRRSFFPTLSLISSCSPSSSSSSSVYLFVLLCYIYIPLPFISLISIKRNRFPTHRTRPLRAVPHRKLYTATFSKLFLSTSPTLFFHNIEEAVSSYTFLPSPYFHHLFFFPQ